MASRARTNESDVSACANYTNHHQSIGNFRLIFGGSRSVTPGMNDWKNDTAGTVNVGPNGVGYLLSSGYLSDPGVYFCPSSEGMPVAPIWSGAGAKLFNAATNRHDFSRAGAVDGPSTLRGDWSWLPYSCSGTLWDLMMQRMILSHYNYRLVPVTTMSGKDVNGNALDMTSSHWRIYFNSVKPADVTPEMAPAARMFHTRPDRTVRLGEPVFKTQKMLQARALMSDTFEKNMLPSAMLQPGAGFYAHRDGYNVLYGDWSARWYGDPQQRLIWWSLSASMTGPFGFYAYGLGNNTLNDMVTLNREGAQRTCRNNGPVAAWHALDVDAGVDVGVDE